MGKILTYLVIFCLTMAMLSACNTGGCTDLRSAVPRADFYSSDNNRPITVDSLSITGIGVPGDSVLYGPGTRNNSVYLPMPPVSNTVRWRFAYMQKDLAASGIADTLTIDFERTPWFAGEECGAMFKYRITSVQCTANVIDSVTVVDSVVVNVDNPSLNIYFHTAQEE